MDLPLFLGKIGICQNLLLLSLLIRRVRTTRRYCLLILPVVLFSASWSLICQLWILMTAFYPRFLQLTQEHRWVLYPFAPVSIIFHVCLVLKFARAQCWNPSCFCGSMLTRLETISRWHHSFVTWVVRIFIHVNRADPALKAFPLVNALVMASALILAPLHKLLFEGSLRDKWHYCHLILNSGTRYRKCEKEPIKYLEQV